jgi:outer membrane receptor protein involved in Fe transport
MNLLSKNGVRAGLMASTLLTSAGLTSAGLAMLATLAVPTLASAQDFSSGALVGHVVDGAGAPVGGAAVVVKSRAQGFERTLTTDADGQFRAPSIPIGAYSVSISKDGFQPTSDGNVQVRLGGSTSYSFTLAGAGDVDAVVVTASANPQLDFSQSSKGMTVDLETLVKQVPVGRDVTSVAFLAPGVVLGDTAFGNQPSLVGSGVSENAFYVNGLNVTNFATGIGGSTIPFDFYKTVEVKTGGISAEYGRATGGVINAVTKSGSNDFHFAVHGNWAPNGLRETSPDTFEEDKSKARSSSANTTFEVSGPIIEDRLFFYVMNQQQQSSSTTYSNEYASKYTDKQNDPFWGVKLDGYVTDKQRLEFTYLDTTRVTDRTTYGYADGVVGTTPTHTRYELGGVSWIGKYTGTITDWLTISAAYGVNHDRNSSLPSNTSDPYVYDSASLGSTKTRVGTQTSSTTTYPALMDREFWRADADVYFSLLGDHHVRLGYEDEKLTYTKYVTTNGGHYYYYYTAGASNTLGLAAGDKYVRVTTYRAGGKFEGHNQAAYIQDSWDVTDRLNLQLGVRVDKMQQSNGSGDTFAAFNHEIGPRLGFSWDPVGDKMNKVFGSYGRYYQPIAANTAYRMSSAELYFSEFYKYSGYNATTYVPTLTTQITTATNPTAVLKACPAGGVSAAGTVGCAVSADGVAPTSDNISAQNLKSTYEDEFVLGYERRFNSLWKASATLTYRNLGRTAEDAYLDAAVVRWCERNGVSGCAAQWPGDTYYLLINPGSSAVVKLNQALPGESEARTITLTSSDLALPKAKREYIGLEFAFERAFDGKWGLQGSYVISESKGNYEGGVKSDIGQSDTGITQDYDFASVMDGAYGLLPNHHGHQIKVTGSYQLTDSLMVGGNLSVIAPRYYGCIGYSPTDDLLNADYGAAAWYCNGTSTPRGSQFKTDWTTRFDVSLRYTVPTTYVPGGNLVLRADVFNLFNLRAVTEAYEYGQTDSGAIDTDYGKPTSYQAPRYVRVGFDWSF